MENYTISEGTAEYELANNPKIKAGDTITFAPGNQAEYLKYKVVEGSEGERTLKLIDSYAHQMGYYDIDTADNNGYNTDNEENDSQDSQSGGKKRKTNKRKTNKRKTNKRK